jgi:hypothetical protein
MEIARQMGHTPTMTLQVYGDVFDEPDPAERLPTELLIRRAREEVGVRFVSAGAAQH